MLSRKAKYALIACVNLARHFDRGSRLIADLVEEERLPRKFVEAILLELKNAGILDSKKGKGGGYQLARSPSHIMIGEIVRTIDGPIAPFRCASVTAPVMCEECKSPATCGIREVMREVRDAQSAVIDNTSLLEVVEREERLTAERTPSLMYHI